MIAENIFMGLSLISPNGVESTTDKVVPQTQKRIETIISEQPNYNENKAISSQKFLEILQRDVKEKIINGAIYYFEHDVNFQLNKTEMDQLKKDLTKYLSKNPNIISLSGNRVIWKMNDNQFKDLFKILLPYFRKGDALKNHRLATSGMILGYIENFAGPKEAEFYYFYYFGRFFMEIVKQLNGSMTIGEFINEMTKLLKNDHIVDSINSGEYKTIRYLDVRQLDSEGLKKRFNLKK